MTSDITIAVKYSTLPCPNGCSLSAGFPATFIPIMVTEAEKASDRLFNASIRIAIELETRPMHALNIESRILVPTPIQLARIMTFSLSIIELF